MNEMNHEYERGLEAKRLLDNPTLKEALDAIENAVVQQWEDCPARDSEGREQLWMLYKLSKKVRYLLEGYVQTGRLAEENMRIAKEKRFKFF